MFLVQLKKKKVFYQNRTPAKGWIGGGIARKEEEIKEFVEGLLSNGGQI